LSQSRVAELCGVAKTTVIAWEKGSKIPADALAALHREGLDVVYVITGQPLEPQGRVAEEPNTYNMSPEERALHFAVLVHDVLFELDVELDKEQFKVLLGYAYEHGPTKEQLRAFVEAAAAIAGIRKPPRNPSESSREKK